MTKEEIKKLALEHNKRFGGLYRRIAKLGWSVERALAVYEKPFYYSESFAKGIERRRLKLFEKRRGR